MKKMATLALAIVMLVSLASAATPSISVRCAMQSGWKTEDEGLFHAKAKTPKK